MLHFISILLMSIFIISCQSQSGSVSDNVAAQVSPADIDLIKAIKEGNLSLARESLDRGANPNQIHHYQGGTVTPLLIAAAYGADSIYQLLIHRGADEKFSYKRFSAQEIHAYTKKPGGQ